MRSFVLIDDLKFELQDQQAASELVVDSEVLIDGYVCRIFDIEIELIKSGANLDAVKTFHLSLYE